MTREEGSLEDFQIAGTGHITTPNESQLPKGSPCNPQSVLEGIFARFVPGNHGA